jgi:hypothetical protein
MSATPQVQDLSGWIARIRGQEMPVFARTVEGLRRIIGDVPGVNYLGRCTTTILAGGSEAWWV